MAYSFLLLVMTCLFAIQSVSAAYNISILSPITTPSHTNILKPLVMALGRWPMNAVTPSPIGMSNSIALRQGWDYRSDTR